MTAPTLTLADFLLARIAEDEADYRDAMHIGCVEDDSDGPNVIHSARCPNRILAECQAKAKVVGLYLGSVQARGDGRSGVGLAAVEMLADVLEDALRALALPYRLASRLPRRLALEHTKAAPPAEADGAALSLLRGTSS